MIHQELGNLYWALKRYDFAVPHLQWAIRIKQRLNGEFDQSVEPSLAKLAAVYQDMGDQQKSAETMAKAMEISRRYGRRGL